ncbi:MAG: hypothetical protein PT116_21495 [Aphanizomenon gracile PMC638.10]|nr:hypothetical protein [Aphanizomenon gracile PMC638.10]
MKNNRLRLKNLADIIRYHSLAKLSRRSLSQFLGKPRRSLLLNSWGKLSAPNS